MPHYTITVTPQGPLLNVVVNITGARAAALLAAGKPVPQPVIANLLVDTGASMTSIDASVISQLGLEHKNEVKILTPSTGATPHVCKSYDVELTITGPTSKVVSAIEVIDGHYLNQGHHGLIGRDILAEGRIVYSGPDRAVLLSF